MVEAAAGLDIKQWIAIALIILTMIVMSQIMSGSGKKSAVTKSEEKKPQGALVTFRGKLTKEEVALHNKPTDAWIIVEDKVYDITSYIDLHPGGDSILNNVGKDSTEGFLGPQHPTTSRDVLETYYIGDVVHTISIVSYAIRGSGAI